MLWGVVLSEGFEWIFSRTFLWFDVFGWFMTELFVTPHFLLFREEVEKKYVALEDAVDILVRSLSEIERKYFREQRALEIAQKRGFLHQPSCNWNGEEQAKELGFYVFTCLNNEELGSIPYGDIVVPYQRVVQLASLIADEKLRDEYVCDVRREVAALKLDGVYLELYSSTEKKRLYDGVRLFLSEEYDVKVKVNVGREKMVN